MRNNSKKQSAASRANGAKGSGPKSADGKQKSRLNALKGGLFSREVVVTAAGERVEDFELVRSWVWDSVQPEDAMQEILTIDVVENWWRRQRVRRCQTADLQNQLQNLKIHDHYLDSDQIQPVKIRFQLSLERYQAITTSTTCVDQDKIVTELEEARSQLASTPLGLEVLIKKVNAVKNEAESGGQISAASQVALRACAGLTNEFALHCAVMNGINIKESAKRSQARQREPEKAQMAEESDEADRRFMLVYVIEMVAGELKFRKQLLEGIEKLQAKTRLAAAVLRADSSCDRFARAETAYDRRLYRAMALLIMRHGKDASKILPG